MIAIVDIDGVLADATHREHFVTGSDKDWDSFFSAVAEDPPIERGIARALELSTTCDVVLLSGRPERTRADTEDWLLRHGVCYRRLVLRGDRDFRRADAFKADAIGQIGTPDDVAVVVDDDVTVASSLGVLGYRTEVFG